jgi:hypothetical protein
VAQIGRQVGKKTLNILTFAIPCHEPPDCEGVAEVVKARLIVETVCAFHAGFITNAFER